MLNLTLENLFLFYAIEKRKLIRCQNYSLQGSLHPLRKEAKFYDLNKPINDS